jgi:hypothetical protein
LKPVRGGEGGEGENRLSRGACLVRGQDAALHGDYIRWRFIGEEAIQADLECPGPADLLPRTTVEADLADETGRPHVFLSSTGGAFRDIRDNL